MGCLGDRQCRLGESGRQLLSGRGPYREGLGSTFCSVTNDKQEPPHGHIAVCDVVVGGLFCVPKNLQAPPRSRRILRCGRGGAFLRSDDLSSWAATRTLAAGRKRVTSSNWTIFTALRCATTSAYDNFKILRVWKGVRPSRTLSLHGAPAPRLSAPRKLQ
jgi:hypothetical protein